MNEKFFSLSGLDPNNPYWDKPVFKIIKEFVDGKNENADESCEMMMESE